MCGFAGVVSFVDGAAAHAALAEHMIEALAHRGPDGEGRYSDPRYERHAWLGRAIMKRASSMRAEDRSHGRIVFFPIRYADDFLVLVGAPPDPNQDDLAREAAFREKEELTKFLRDELRLELSATKTLVTPVTRRMRFLEHHVCVRPHPKTGRMVSTAVVPRDASQRLRERIKAPCHSGPR